jgi:hypothetical protein
MMLKKAAQSVKGLATSKYPSGMEPQNFASPSTTEDKATDTNGEGAQPHPEKEKKKGGVQKDVNRAHQFRRKKPGIKRIWTS